jgi:hypothetical protein
MVWFCDEHSSTTFFDSIESTQETGNLFPFQTLRISLIQVFHLYAIDELIQVPA